MKGELLLMVRWYVRGWWQRDDAKMGVWWRRDDAKVGKGRMGERWRLVGAQELDLGLVGG